MFVFIAGCCCCCWVSYGQECVYVSSDTMTQPIICVCRLFELLTFYVKLKDDDLFLQYSGAVSGVLGNKKLAINAILNHHRHHHHGLGPGWSIAVSTVSPMCSILGIFPCRGHSKIVRLPHHSFSEWSQLCRGRLQQRLNSLGSPHLKSPDDVKWIAYSCRMSNEEAELTCVDEWLRVDQQRW